MSGNKRFSSKPSVTKPKKTSKETVRVPVDKKPDIELENLSQSDQNETMTKPTSAKSSPTETAAVGSKDTNIGFDGKSPGINSLPATLLNAHRPVMEINASSEIPTISMNEVDDNETTVLGPQVTVAPDFSISALNFKEIQKNYFRERLNKYIDPKIDVNILYRTLPLHEDIDDEDKKLWQWDKIFVEIRNAITNPTANS